jgi:type II secretory pathway pseudopilin PulG
MICNENGYMKMISIHRHSRQQGTAIIVVLLLLIALTLIVLSGSRNTTMQLRMSSNLESRIEALEFAQAGLDFAESIPPTAIPVSSNNVCSNFHPDADTGTPTLTCDTRIAMPAPFDNSNPNATSWLVMKRDTGLEGSLPRGLKTSANLLSAAYFQAFSSYDNTANGRGRADLVAGIMKMKLNDRN